MKLTPRLQKDILCQIFYVRGSYPRQQYGMHHAKESAVQFAECGIVAIARGVDHRAQFDSLVCYALLLKRS